MANKPPTPNESIRQMCLDCLGASTAKAAYDCIGRSCKLYPVHPFRDKPVTLEKAYRESEGERRNRISAHKACPPRKPSKTIIGRHCWDCNNDSRADCGNDACALFYWRPFQPGGQPKRKLSAIRRKVAQANARNMAVKSGQDLPKKLRTIRDALIGDRDEDANE